MGNTLDCPKSRWICITICSQGGEGGVCPYVTIVNTGRAGWHYQSNQSHARVQILDEREISVDNIHAPGVFVKEDIEVDFAKVMFRHMDESEFFKTPSNFLRYVSIL